jgi:3-oxoacyl-[acyl-carrier-protein] synthase-3
VTYPQRTSILGIGRYLPRRVVTSAELEAKLGLEPGWIEATQGVRERRWADRDESNSFMGAAAAREAMAEAGLGFGSVDLIVNASGTQEQAIPDGGPLIQRQLGLEDSGVPCLTVHATCLSFVVGLDLCSNLLATGRYATILLVTSEISSCALNWASPESSTLFGDAAAAVVLGRTPAGEASRVSAARVETYGSGAEFTEIRGGGSRRHPSAPETTPEDNLFRMSGLSVFRQAARVGPGFIERLRPGLSRGPGSVKLFISHQASKIALDALRTLNVPQERVPRTLDRFGNCVAASVPITLYEAIREGRMVRGDEVILMGTGAGLTLAAVILTY